MRPYLLLPFVAVIAAASPAMAFSVSGDCEGSPDGCSPPPPPPTKSPLPALSGKSGDYRVAIDTNGNIRDGYVEGDTTTYFGGGPFRPIGGNGTLSVGIGQSMVTLAATRAPDATATVTATADQNFSSQGSMFTGYLVELHARDAAAFALLQPFVSTSGAIASIAGHYTLTQSGQAYSQAAAATGTGLGLDQSLEKYTYGICDRSGYYSRTGTGCGSFGYTLDLNFKLGSSFADGDPLSLYSTVQLSTGVHAGRTGLTGVAGQSSAFIDPTITLNPLFNSPLYTLSSGGTVVSGAGAVPEPAAWAMMLSGFALVGSVVRRQRMRTVAA